MKLKGKVFEIGNLSDHSGRGMRMECDGDDFAIIGLTEEECREAAKWFGEEVEITIGAAGDTATPDTKTGSGPSSRSERTTDQGAAKNG